MSTPARPHGLVADVGHALRLIGLGFAVEASRILSAHADPLAVEASALLGEGRFAEAVTRLTAFADAYALA